MDVAFGSFDDIPKSDDLLLSTLQIPSNPC